MAVNFKRKEFIMITVCNRNSMPVVAHGSMIVYVGRGTPLGNNYHIGTHGNRTTVIGKYRKWLWNQLQDPDSKANQWIERLLLRAKQGTNIYLQCSCHPEACHADIIKRCLDWKLSQQLTKFEFIQSKRHGAKVQCEIKTVPFKNGKGFHIGAYAVDDGKFVQWLSHDR
jgi:hypothetical protein